MIRLIASDIDGTLLQGTERNIPPQIFREIDRLLDRGVFFCAASGRQYDNLRRLFGAVGQRMYFISENGSVIFGPGTPGKLLSKVPMMQPQAMELCRDILAMPECELMVSGVGTCYLCPKGPVVLPHVRDYVGNLVTEIAAPELIPEEPVKISAFCEHGTDTAYAALSPRWADVFDTAVAGECWVDFTPVNKGNGVCQVCELLGIPLSDVMAFGDNYNDLAMLSIVGQPYVMANGAPELLRRFPRHCGNVHDVLTTLCREPA